MVEPLWRRLGAHVVSGGVDVGVWAPRASAVSVIGDFCDWDRDAHPLTRDGDGTWRAHVPGLGPGEIYQLSVRDAHGTWQDHADPLARRAQIPPQRGSVVEVSTHVWQDEEWMRSRASRRPHAEPMTTYEVHLGSWRRGLTYRQLAEQLVPYVADLGFSHVELMPLTEHPYHGSWGYQVSGYFAPTARHGTPDDLRSLVDAFHAAGIAVVLDWVPGHFPRDEWALARFDGEPLYEPPEAALHPEWGTLPFDLSRPQVREFLVASALYWLEELHVDGLRVDAVETILFPPHAGGAVDPAAVELLRELNVACHAAHPGIAMIAEDASTFPDVTRPVDAGGLGFGFKWSLGWMHDTLRYLVEDPLWRQNHHGLMTLPMTYAEREHWILPLSHDEVVHGKGPLLDRFPGDESARAATLRALLAWQWAHPGRPLVFMGTELGQTREWVHRRSLDWEHADPGVAALVRDLNTTHRAHPALWAGDHAVEGFRWLLQHEASSNVLAFVREHAGPDGTDVVVVVANLAGVDHDASVVPLPSSGRWTVVVSTADPAYGGPGGPSSVTAGEPIHLPALSTLWLVPEGGP